MAKFISLKVQGKVSNDFACALLEQAIKPEVLREVLLTNTDISIWDDFTEKTLKVGRNLEWLQILRGGGYGYQRSSGGGAHFSAAGTQPGAPWTSAPRAKDNHSRGLATLSVTTASSSGTSPVTAKTKRSHGARLHKWLG